MKLSVDEIGPLFDALQTLRDKDVQIRSSLSRGPRDQWAHNRHCSTSLNFTFVVINTTYAISGSRLILMGQKAHFSIGADDVTSFSIEPDGTIEVIEQFEQKTERITRLTPLQPKVSSCDEKHK